MKLLLKDKQKVVMSPLPFGVHRVHHYTRTPRVGLSKVLSPLPLGVHRVHHHTLVKQSY